MNKTLILISLMLLAVGCTPTPVPDPSPTNPPRMKVSRSKQHAQAAMMSTVAAAAEAPMGMRVDIYQLQVPYGTVSRNEKFWKRIDEQCVDVGTYDLLYKNGVRAGQASIEEWEYFRQVMQEYPAVTNSNSLVAAENKPVELAVRKEVASQEIFYFDKTNLLQGKSYDACENLITLTFQHAPRKPQTMRVVVCPVVRSKIKRLEYSPLNNEIPVEYTAPERLYNVNLRTDVAVDHFLVVAPSPESTWPTSIGNKFFVTDGVAEQMENVLLVVPKSIRIEQTPLTAGVVK
jgi:hypothetical protein